MKVFKFLKTSYSNVHINLRDSYVLYYVPDEEKFFGKSVDSIFKDSDLFVSDDKDAIDEFKQILKTNTSKELFNNKTQYSLMFDKEIDCNEFDMDELLETIQISATMKKKTQELYTKFLDKTEIYTCTIYKIFNSGINGYVYSVNARKGNSLLSTNIKLPDFLTEDEAINAWKAEAEKRGIKEYELKIENMKVSSEKSYD